MPKEADVYDQMGDFYDFVYSEDFDSDFYLKEAKKAKGKVLELGCGTGRISIKLAKEGIQVTGLDISEKMLELLKRNAMRAGIHVESPLREMKGLEIENAMKAGVNIKTHLGDMRDFQIDDKFKLAIFPYRSFLHLLSSSDREKAVRNIYKHLEKGGKMILHIYQPSQDELDCTGELHKIDENSVVKGGKGYTLQWFFQYKPENGTADYVISVRDENGEEKEKFEMTISFVTLNELKTILEEAGFRNIKAYCGFEYEDYNPICQEVVVVAEK